MKPNTILLPALLALLAAGCNANKGTDVVEHVGPWAGDELANAAMNNAIVAQHTLYPYHFEAGSARLNELGNRDLNVLVDHFLQAGGGLNVRRGGAAQPLYEERVKAVLERLAAAGVAEGAVSVQDGLPGGEGMSSERVIVLLKEKMSKGSSIASGGASGSGASASATSGSTLK